MKSQETSWKNLRAVWWTQWNKNNRCNCLIYLLHDAENYCCSLCISYLLYRPWIHSHYGLWNYFVLDYSNWPFSKLQSFQFKSCLVFKHVFWLNANSSLHCDCCAGIATFVCERQSALDYILCWLLCLLPNVIFWNSNSDFYQKMHN